MTTVAGLLCPLDPSDPVGLQMVSLGSQISGRSRGSDGPAALSRIPRRAMRKCWTASPKAATSAANVGTW